MTAPSHAERARIAAAAWVEYCERLKGAARLLLREDIPAGELDLAEGLRYLAHLSFAGIQRFLDGADPARPFFYLLCDERIKSGGDNPDNRYYVAAVADDYEYELAGRFGGCTYYSIVALDRKDMTAGLSAQERARRTAAARLDSATLETDRDGCCRVHIGRAARPGNHLRIDEHSNMIIVRCTFEGEGPREVELSIRRVDGHGAGPGLTLEEVSRRLKAAADHVGEISTFFGGWTARFQRHLNQLPLGDQDYIRSTGGDPNILYYLSAWLVHPGQALVVHLGEVPPCVTWNFQLCNVWLESLDYTSARIHLNATTARRDRDGGVTLLICGSDPGHPNWLETTGHACGTMCMRFTGAAYPASAATALVSLDEARALGSRLQ